MLGRLKFELDGLAQEMLDQLPASVFKSKTTTFLDPCMGGGQFVAAIERRLREHGHSDANITKRVYGVESSQLRLNYAVNKYNLVGNNYFVCENYLEYDETMKFDVVIGNPPYQKSDNKASRWTLWEEFVNKSYELSDGYVCMVVPQSVTSPRPFNIIKDTVEVLNVDVSKYFNVGSTFCYFVSNVNGNDKATKIITGDGTFKKKVQNMPFLPFVVSKETFKQLEGLQKRKSRTWKRGELHTSNKKLFKEKGKYTVFHTNAQELMTDTEHENRKKTRVAVSLSGYPKFVVVRNGYVSQACFWTEFDTVKEAKAFAAECNGQEVQDIMKNFKWSGWNSKEVIQCL